MKKTIKERLRLGVFGKQGGSRLLAIVLAVLMVTSGVGPFAQLSPVEPARAMNATTDGSGDLHDDFESGDLSKWNIDSGNPSTSQEWAIDTYSMALSSSDSTDDTVSSSFSSHSPNNVSFWFNYTEIDDDATRFVLRQSSNQVIDVYFHNGNVKNESASSSGISVSNNTAYRVELDFDFPNDQFNVTIYDTNGDMVGSDSGWSFDTSASEVDEFFIAERRTGSAGGTNTLYIDDIYFDYEPATPDPVSGHVDDQHGDACVNCTVEIVAVDASNLTTDDGQSKLDRARELLDDATNPLPSSWNPDLSITGEDGVAENAGAEYVAVNRPEDWATPGWVSTIDLSSPTVNPPAEEPITLTAWDPAKEGGSLTIENTVDNSLPGATVKRNIVVERLDPFGDVVDKDTLEPNRKLETGYFTSKRSHPYVETTLQAGVYRVYPEGAKNTAYTIVVGNVDDLRKSFATDLTDESDRLTEAGKRIQDRYDSGKFVRTTTTTNATGHYTADVPESVNLVAVSAYKIDGETLTSLEDPTPQDMRAYVVNNDYNGSVSMSLEPRRYEPPTQNADVGVRKFSSPPYALLDAWATKWSEFRDLVENGTLTDLGSIYRVPLEEWNETQLENGAEDVATVIEQSNQDLVDEWEDRTGERWEDFRDELEESERTNDQLRDDIRSMERAISSLEDQLDAVDEPTDRVRDGNAEFRQVFDGDFDESNVVATWNDYDGTSTPIPAEYVSVNKRTGQGDEVVVDYPIPDGSNGGTIGVLVVDENGNIGSSKGRYQAGDVKPPEIRAFDVSSLQPGPAERVSIEPKIDTAGATVESVDVWGPSGSINSTWSNGEAEFATSSSGEYFVRFTLERNGETFRESFKLAAGDEPHDFRESVRIVDGTTGVYAIAGDRIDDADVELADSGRSIEITALVDDEQGTNEVHFYTAGGPSSARERLALHVVTGSSIDTSTSIGRHVGIYIHGREIADDAVMYRYGVETAPIPHDGETKGGKITDGKQGGTVIHSYTRKSGSVDVSIANDPGRLEGWKYRFDLWTARNDYF